MSKLDELTHSPKEIAEFIVGLLPSYEEQMEGLVRAIEKHIEYKTCIIVADENGIVAFSCWDMSENMREAHIYITCIKPSHRRRKFLKYLIAKGASMYPSARFILWDRDFKGVKQRRRIAKIRDILK